MAKYYEDFYAWRVLVYGGTYQQEHRLLDPRIVHTASHVVDWGRIFHQVSLAIVDKEPIIWARFSVYAKLEEYRDATKTLRSTLRMTCILCQNVQQQF